MEKKVLILGAQGMLGQALAEVFSDQNPVLWDSADLDITQEEEVKSKLKELKPTLIINAAGYTDVDGAESNEQLAMAVNGKAVGYLGTKKQGYKEDDQPNPISAYGSSKLEGEKLLQEKGEMYYLIRASWMFGEFGAKNFIKTILTKAKQEGKLKVVNDQFGKPTYAADLAQKTREIIDKMKPCGIYHITNETKKGGITWYDLAQKAIELKGIEAEITPCTTEEFPTPAKRPKYAALINTKLEPIRSWEGALKDYLANIKL
jgi:dTDP-4-dehydrorhamnose reductase